MIELCGEGSLIEQCSTLLASLAAAPRLSVCVHERAVVASPALSGVIDLASHLVAGMSGLFRNLDAWRKHPLLKPRIQDYVPGLGTAIIAFSAYLVFETATKPSTPKDSHH